MRRDLLAAVATVAILVTGAAFAAETQTAPITGGRTEVAQASQGNARVRVKSARLRARPDAHSAKVGGSLPRGTRLQVLDSSGDWTHVRVGNRTGYVLSSLLTM